MHTNLRLTLPSSFRLDLTVWVLRRIEKNQIDQWDGKTYSRALIVRRQATEVHVTQGGPTAAPTLLISAHSGKALDSTDIKETLSKMLGLSVDLSDFYNRARNDKLLANLAA